MTLGQVTAKVLSSYAEGTGDSFLKYYDETSYRAYLASTKNPEAGIGVLFGENDGKCFCFGCFRRLFRCCGWHRNWRLCPINRWRVQALLEHTRSA